MRQPRRDTANEWATAGGASGTHGCSTGRALNENDRRGACKFSTSVKAEEPMLAPRSHVASRQGTARPPLFAASGAKSGGQLRRPTHASAETTPALPQKQDSMRGYSSAGKTSINSDVRCQLRRDRPSNSRSVTSRPRRNQDQSRFRLGVERLSQTIWLHNRKAFIQVGRGGADCPARASYRSNRQSGCSGASATFRGTGQKRDAGHA